MRKTNHVRRDEARKVEHGIAIKRQIIPDQAIGDFLGHVAFWHFMLGEFLCCETRAIDGDIGFGFGRFCELDILHALNDGAALCLCIVGYGCEMNHDCRFTDEWVLGEW